MWPATAGPTPVPAPEPASPTGVESLDINLLPSEPPLLSEAAATAVTTTLDADEHAPDQGAIVYDGQLDLDLGEPDHQQMSGVLEVPSSRSLTSEQDVPREPAEADLDATDELTIFPDLASNMALGGRPMPLLSLPPEGAPGVDSIAESTALSSADVTDPVVEQAVDRSSAASVTALTVPTADSWPSLPSSRPLGFFRRLVLRVLRFVRRWPSKIWRWRKP